MVMKSAEDCADMMQPTCCRLRAMGIRDRPISPRSPWQNGYSERLSGSIRRDCLDHVVVFGERHLRHLLNSYQRYYNEVRTHLSLQKDAPLSREVRRFGRVLSVPLLGGYTISMFEFEFPTRTTPLEKEGLTHTPASCRLPPASCRRRYVSTKLLAGYQNLAP